MSEQVHIAGLRISIGPLRRQRCAWCGVVLCDDDLRNLAVPIGQDSEPGGWEPGKQIAVDGGMSYVIDGDQLPETSCTNLDPAVTQ
jgi:hypothetical protein